MKNENNLIKIIIDPVLEYVLRRKEKTALIFTLDKTDV